MPRVPTVSKPSIAPVTLVRGAVKNGAKAPPPPRPLVQEQHFPKADDEPEVCPLCVEDLDPTDKEFQPCPCGYRVCLFCFEKLKLHCNSACPNCRRGYGSDEAMEYAKQLEAERVQEALRPKAPAAPAPAVSTSAPILSSSRAPPKPVPTQPSARRDAAPIPAAKRSSGALDECIGHGASSGLPSGVTWATPSPSRLSRNQSVEIERPAISMDESSWPSLGAPAAHQQLQQQQQPHTTRHHHQHSQQQQQQHTPHYLQQQLHSQHAQSSASSSVHVSSSGAAPSAHALQQQHQHRHSPSAASEGLNSYDMSGAGTRRSSSVASSMDRVASSSSLELMSQDPPVTPEQLLQLQHQHQQYQAQHAQVAVASLSSSSSAFPPMAPPGFETSSSYFSAQVATTVNGLRRTVNVPLSLGNSNVEPYPEAPALLSSMQQGVAQGTLSSKEGASQLLTFLRQKDHEGQVARTRSGLAATKPPPGFGVPSVPPPAMQQPPVSAQASTAPAAAVAAAPSMGARPPPPPGFSHLQGSVVQAPPVARAPIQPPMQQGADGSFGGASGPIGLNANGTPRTYSMWSGLPGMDLAASTGLSSLWQNLNASALSLGGQLGGGATQPYNPLGLMDQAMPYAPQRQPVPGAAPKAPPPGFGPSAYAGAQQVPGAAAQQQLGSGDAVLGNNFRAQLPYQPVGGTRYNPLNQPPPMPGAYRPQLGAGL